MLGILCIRKGELCHTYTMFMFQILCFRKRETVSCMQYVYVIDFVHKKEENCITPTICLCSRFCVSGRGEVFHTYSMCLIQTLYIRDRGTVSQLQHCYDLGVRDMIIECLYVCLLDFICASTATLYSCFFLFSCYFIRCIVYSRLGTTARMCV